MNVKCTDQFSETNILKQLHTNRSSLPVFSGQKRFDGSVDILLKSFDDASLAKDLLENKLQGLTVSPPIPNRMKYCSLVGLGFEMSVDDVTDSIIEENAHWMKLIKVSKNRIGLEGDPLSVIDVIDVKECNNTVELKVNVKISPNMLASLGKRKLSIGHSLCRLYRFKSHRRCFQCQQIGHFASECENNIACSRCGLEHSSHHCNSKVVKCVNCSINNRDDTNHPSYSSICPYNTNSVKR